MKLTLKWRGASKAGRVSLEALTRALVHKKTEDIAQCKISHGRHTYPLGELFKVQGELNSQSPHVVLKSRDVLLHDVGAGWSRGLLEVVGNVGDYCGAAMTGGEIVVRGSVRHYGGASMQGGVMRVKKNAGDFLAAPMAMASLRDGQTVMAGMNGGLVHIGGAVGHHAGSRMRRGMVVVNGTAGDYCAARMLAGTLIVRGSLGKECGRMMRRGTLIAFARRAGDAEQWLAKSFVEAGEQNLIFLQLLRQSLHQMNMSLPLPAIGHRFVGDRAIGGKGEILLL